MHILCPHCKNAIELVELRPREEISCAACGSSFQLESSSTTGYGGGALETLGRFELLGTLGQGAFGTVYKARDPKLDRVVAVKVPRRDNVGTSEQDRDRFLREARSAAQLRHPSIVAVHEVVAEGELTYLVSDFVDGVTLADRLTAGRPSVRDAANIVAAVAEALQYAHSQGVVHRDVKPSNIMVRPDGTPVVMDFGLAKRDAGEITMTVDGQILGTPAYMSPEQARGEGHRVDGRSDVYSLGVILYQLLTGELPFRGNTRMLLHQVLHYEPKPPRSLNDRLPRDLETVCLKAMAKEPGRRYATAGELAADLRRWLGGEPILARPVGRVEHTWRWARRNPAAALAGAFGVLALAALAAAGVQLANSGRLATAYKAEFEAREEAEDARAGEEEQRKAAEGARKVAELAEGKARDALNKMEQVEYYNSILIAGTAVKEGRDLDARAALDTCREDLRSWEWYQLQAACYREHLAAKGVAFAFSPIREEIACAEEDGTIHIWSLVNGREVSRAPMAAGGGVSKLDYSPCGRWLVAAGKSGVRLWDADGGRELWKADGYYFRVAFSPDGKLLAATSQEYRLSAATLSELRLWEVDGGRELWKAVGFNGPLAFRPDSRRLAVVVSREVRLLDAGNGRELNRFDGNCSDVAFSPDGRRLVACGNGGVRIWDADGGRELCKVKGSFSGVAFHPDGRRLAVFWRGGCGMWDADSGRELWKVDGSYLRLAFSPDGRRLAAAGDNSGVRLLDADGGRELWRAEGDSHWLAFSPDGRRLATGSRQHGLRLWEVDGGLGMWKVVGRISGEVFSPDGRRLAAGGEGGLRVLEAASGHEVWKADGPYYLQVAFSPDGRQVAAVGSSSGLRLWEADRGRELWKADGAFQGVAFSPDGRRVAAVGISGVWLWEAASGRELWRAAGIYGHVEFSPDGRRLIAGGPIGGATVWDSEKRFQAGEKHSTVRLWEADGGRELWKADGYEWATFSPDGRRLAATGFNGVRLWEVDGGRELWKADGYYYHVAFSPDGKRLVSSGLLIGVRLWEADGGRELWKDDGYRWATFSPDGRRLVTGGSKSGVRMGEADGSRSLWKADWNYDWVTFSVDGKMAMKRFGASPTGQLILVVGGKDGPSLLASRRQAIHDTRARWHSETALSCEARGEWFAAAFHWEQQARTDSAHGTPHYHRAQALERLGRISDAEREFKAALERRTTLPIQTVADCHAMLGQYDEAAKLYLEAAKPPTALAEMWWRSSLLRLGVGDLDGYRATCKTLIQRFGKAKAAAVANDAAWGCAIGPNSLPDLKPAIDLAQQAVKSAPKNWSYHETLGAVLFRSGKHAEAVTELETAIRLHGKGGSPLTLFFLAMAQHRLGKTDDARKSLEQAEKLSQQEPVWFWSDKLERQLLLREAEALVHGNAK